MSFPSFEEHPVPEEPINETSSIIGAIFTTEDKERADRIAQNVYSGANTDDHLIPSELELLNIFHPDVLKSIKEGKHAAQEN